MKITILNRIFSPGLASTCIFLILFPMMTGLGYWQYQRSVEKQQMLSDIDALANLAPIFVQKRTQLENAKLYQSVYLEAKLLVDKLIYVENRPQNGQGAADVYLPAVFDDQVIILINLGWVFLPDRNKLPEIKIPQDIRLDVILDDFPQAGWKLGELVIPDKWPALLARVEQDKLKQWFGMRVFGKIGRLKIPIDKKLHTDWNPSVMPPSKHQGYAFQWFAMAIALMVLYFTINMKNVAKNES